MKNISKFAGIAILTLCSAAAFAGEKQSVNLDIHHEAMIAGVKVPAGEYKMVVEHDGGKAHFTLMNGKKKIVETDAHFTELKSFVTPTAVVTGENSRVIQIEASKLKGAVVFDQAAGVAGGK